MTEQNRAGQSRGNPKGFNIKTTMNKVDGLCPMQNVLLLLLLKSFRIDADSHEG